jgi:hypothetical protein
VRAGIETSPQKLIACTLFDGMSAATENRLSMALAVNCVFRVETVRSEEITETNFRLLQHWLDREFEIAHEI